MTKCERLVPLTARASAASEPGDRSEPAERRARARVGEFEGRSPSSKLATATALRARLDRHVHWHSRVGRVGRRLGASVFCPRKRRGADRGVLNGNDVPFETEPARDRTQRLQDGDGQLPQHHSARTGCPSQFRNVNDRDRTVHGRRDRGIAGIGSQTPPAGGPGPAARPFHSDGLWGNRYPEEI
jgi:hypothetical protein